MIVVYCLALPSNRGIFVCNMISQCNQQTNIFIYSSHRYLTVKVTKVRFVTTKECLVAPVSSFDFPGQSSFLPHRWGRWHQFFQQTSSLHGFVYKNEQMLKLLANRHKMPYRYWSTWTNADGLPTVVGVGRIRISNAKNRQRWGWPVVNLLDNSRTFDWDSLGASWFPPFISSFTLVATKIEWQMHPCWIYLWSASLEERA